ncbi:MAG: hypothetical protein H0V66_08020 [Bdellovibrionales bacterium]|nr:hypothetical protein [Bdellovibrionales bacterium]
MKKTTEIKNFHLGYVPRKFPAVPVTPIHLNRSARSPSSIPKQAIAKVVLSKNALSIGKSYKVVDGLLTVSAKKYKPEMGKKISENAHFVFFQPSSHPAEAWPVAQDITNLRLYPVSHILHVKGIDAAERAQFQAEGMQEYYYHSRLKFISLETSPTTVLKQFQTLTARGFDVRLEVLKDAPRSN